MCRVELLAATIGGLAVLSAVWLRAEPPNARFDLPAPGSSVEHRIAPGETHAYSLEVPAGHYIDLVVLPFGIDVAVAVKRPDGSRLRGSDVSDRPTADEWVLAITDVSGKHQVEVAGSSRGRPASYELIVDGVRPATGPDSDALEGSRYFGEGVSVRQKNTPEAYHEATSAQERAVAAFQAGNAAVGEALALRELGYNRQLLGDREGPFRQYAEALSLFERAGDVRHQIETLDYVAGLHFARGEYRLALAPAERALTLLQPGRLPAEEAVIASRIARIYDRLGQKQRAIDFFSRGLTLWTQLNEDGMVGSCLNNLGRLYYTLGRWPRALDHYQRALQTLDPESPENTTRQNRGTVYSNMGMSYAAMGDAHRGIEYHDRALAIHREFGTPANQASTLSNLGWAYEALGESEAARLRYEEALVFWDKVIDPNGRATTQTHLGRLFVTTGDRPRGLDLLERALATRRAVADPAGEALTLYDLARARRLDGDLGLAQARAEEAVGKLESLRHSVTSPQLRTSFLASVMDYYTLLIDVLMDRHAREPQAGFAAAALQVNERARARSLLESLAEAKSEIHGDLDPALLARERDLQEALDARADAHAAVLRRRHTDEEAAAAAQAVAGLAEEYRELQARVRASDPRRAALTQPEPLEAALIQRLLDDDTALVEFALGPVRSVAWVVRARSLNALTLPPGPVIDAAVRRLQDGVASQDSEAMEAAARALGALILEPLRAHLGAFRLVIVPDGGLQGVPFAALPDPNAGDGRPLLADHEIVLNPSASTLAATRAEAPGRAPPGLMLAMVADPVFEADDPRLSRTAGRPASVSLATRGDAAPARFPRLAGTLREAEALSRLVPAEQRFEAVGFDARREAVTGPAFARARYLHFATHAVLDDRQPELSALLLSRVDRDGRPTSGRLALHDIYNLRLSADLVVLSACQTALGQAVKGEGMISLVRGFMHAGAPRVVATLWQVDDRATAELMTRFYEGMLGAARLRPAAALRAAQLSVARQRRYASPYYWAGFVIQGEWQ